MKPRKTLFLTVLVLVAILIAAACGSESKNSKTTPAATAPASTATTAAPKQTTYPLTVTDMLGRTVTIKAQPQAVAALSPTTVELVYAVGGTSKTRSSNVAPPRRRCRRRISACGISRTTN